MCDSVKWLQRERKDLPTVKRPSYVSAAFSLVEVTLALGVAGFCLLAVFGMLPVGVQTNQRSFSQTAAASILSNVTADIRSAKSLATSPQFGVKVGQANPPLYFNDAGQITTAANARYRLTITFENSANAYPATYADLKVTWPAAIDPDAKAGGKNAAAVPAGSMELFAAFDRH